MVINEALPMQNRLENKYKRNLCGWSGGGEERFAAPKKHVKLSEKICILLWLIWL